MVMGGEQAKKDARLVQATLTLHPKTRNFHEARTCKPKP